MAGKVGVLCAVLVTSAGALLMSAPAQAVQTTTFGLEVAPSSGSNPGSIDHAADGSTVRDAVIVYNRTNSPITVDLSVLNTVLVNGAYVFSAPDAGLAAGTNLGATVVHLGARQEEEVPVTVRMPRGSKTTTLAAIAAESAAIQDGALSIQQRLVVLVKATPSSHVVPLVRGRPDVAPWGIAGGAILLLVMALGTREALKARPFAKGRPAMRTGPAGAGAGG